MTVLTESNTYTLLTDERGVGVLGIAHSTPVPDSFDGVIENIETDLQSFLWSFIVPFGVDYVATQADASTI